MGVLTGVRINGAMEGLGTAINDAVIVTDKAWSSSKIDTDIGALQAGASPKASVDVVTQTAGNITLSGLQNLDGETGVVDDEVGVTAQTDPIENGIYLMKTGAWVRRTDFDGTPSGEVKDGVYFRVTNGTVHQNQVFMVISSGSAVDVGTDPITFDQHRSIEIGTGAGQAAEGNDSRIPTQDENNAMVGTDGTPSTANPFVTNSDVRLGVATTQYAQLSDKNIQNPSVTTPVAITLDTNDEIQGITHSETVNPEEITINQDGVYNVTAQPQVGKTAGAGEITFDMFMQVDTGSGFVDVANSNVKLTIKDKDLTDVIVSSFSIDLNSGDKIRLMQRASSSADGLGLKATAAEVGPPTIPATPSIIFTIFKVGPPV